MGGLQDLVALIRADTPLIVVETADEARTVDLFRQALRQGSQLGRFGEAVGVAAMVPGRGQNPPGQRVVRAQGKPQGGLALGQVLRAALDDQEGPVASKLLGEQRIERRHRGVDQHRNLVAGLRLISS